MIKSRSTSDIVVGNTLYIFLANNMANSSYELLRLKKNAQNILYLCFWLSEGEQLIKVNYV